MWITQRFRTIAVFPINWERLDAGVFTSMLPATKRKSRTSATRETDVISERKHCSRKRRHTQVDFRTRRKCADKTQTIARKRWHGARKRKRSNVRSTCGRLYMRALAVSFPSPVLQFLCSWVNAVRKDFKEEACCSEEFHFLSPWCNLLPCVVLVFPTCKVFSSLGLAVSTFLLYRLTENALWSEDS